MPKTNRFSYAALALAPGLVFFGCSASLNDGGYVDKSRVGPGFTGGNVSNEPLVAEQTIDSVDPVYPNNGANWNDLVLTSNYSNGPFNQPDTICPTSLDPNNEFGACIHGGALKRAALPEDQTDCDGLTMRDSEDVFNWFCKVESGRAVVYSRGLNDGKGLIDLISGTAFKDLSLEVSNSSQVLYRSTPEKWWTNTISLLPDNSDPTDAPADLAGEGAIFVSSGRRNTSGYNVTDDRISIAILDGGTLNYTGNGSSKFCNNSVCIIYLQNRFGTWVEGTLNGNGAASSAVHLYGGRRNRLHNVAALNSSGDGIRVYNSNSNLLYRNITANNAANGLHVNVASGQNSISKLRSFNNTSAGLLIGAFGGSASSNTTTQAILFNNGGHGYYQPQSLRNTLAFSHIEKSGSDNVQIYDPAADFNTLHSIISENPTEFAINYNVGDYNWMSDVYGGNSVNRPNAIRYNGCANCWVFGTLLTDYQSGCTTSGSTGLAAGVNTCTTTGLDGSNYYGGNSSNAIYYGSLVTNGNGGAPTPFANRQSSDSANTSHTSGTDIFSSNLDEFDWVHFQNDYRVWANNTAQADTCGAGETCAIWDVRLTQSGSGFRNRFQNGFTAGQTCTGSIQNSQTLTDRQSPANTFLTHAIEIVGDNTGDEDGLCESYERCVHQPNLGVYPGEGTLSTETCTTPNSGNARSVVIHQFSQNGI